MPSRFGLKFTSQEPSVICICAGYDRNRGSAVKSPEGFHGDGAGERRERHRKSEKERPETGPRQRHAGDPVHEKSKQANRDPHLGGIPEDVEGAEASGIRVGWLHENLEKTSPT